jgi:hypothetical protein
LLDVARSAGLALAQHLEALLIGSLLDVSRLAWQLRRNGDRRQVRIILGPPWRVLAHC